jgi:hypothetical protein
LLSTDALLVVYFVGFGFIALLAWAAIAQDINKPFDDDRRDRWNKVSAIVALVGLAHPALPPIARDIAAQTARTDDDQPSHSRFVTLATCCALVSLIVAGVVIGISIGGG